MKRHYLATVCMLAVAFGATVGGQAAMAQSATDDPELVAAGKIVFESTCVGCHSADGTGSEFGRPLTGIAVEQPDRLINIASVTNGKGTMPVWGEQLSAEEIDAAVSYVRLTFVGQEAELAVTGSSTVPLALIGASLVAAGGALVILIGRRREHGGFGM